MEWGSVQYDASKRIYDQYFEARGNGKSREEALTELGVKVTWKRVRSLEEAKESLVNWLSHRESDPAYKISEEDLEDDRQFAEELNQADSGDELLGAMSEAAWDLWSAAPALCEEFLEGVEFEQLEERPVPEAEGWPIINQMIIGGESTSTGVACALLKELGIVQNEESFSGFST
jgi:hypothetical protein